MQHAQTVLKDSKREKVVVFFTDGEPNHGNGFDTDVANATIIAANALKADNTTIFTVGVLKGADPSDTTTNINKYLHAVSSNYPNATSLNSMGTRPADSDYYKTATDTAGLTRIFKGIVDALKNIGTWIKEHIFQPFIDGFKKVFGIQSPSKEMATLGGYLVDGLKQGLGNIWSKIKEKFTAVKGTLVIQLPL
jgi:hypothetical protein